MKAPYDTALRLKDAAVRLWIGAARKAWLARVRLERTKLSESEQNIIRDHLYKLEDLQK